jgi:predicted esterase
MRAVCYIGLSLLHGLLACSGPDASPGDATASGGGGGLAAGVGGGPNGAGGTGALEAGGDGGGGVPWEPVPTTWCAAEGWLGLDENTCFFAPPEPSDAVLFFAHGMMPADGSPETQQDIVRAAAEQSGFVAVFPRGRQGLCDWDSTVEDWWCWPTSREDVDAHAAELLAEWTAAEALLSQALGATPSRRYVMGFSNGGYYVTYLGLEGLMAAQGFGLVGAGRSYVDESLLVDEQPPMYIAVGELEIDSVKASAENLAFVLSTHQWPHELVVHEDRGHEIRADDFDLAWTAWSAR